MKERQPGRDLDDCIRSATQGFLAKAVRHKENVVGFKSHVGTLPRQDSLEIDCDLLTLTSAGTANDHGMVAFGGGFEIFSNGHQLHHAKVCPPRIHHASPRPLHPPTTPNNPPPRHLHPTS